MNEESIRYHKTEDEDVAAAGYIMIAGIKTVKRGNESLKFELHMKSGFGSRVYEIMAGNEAEFQRWY